MKTRIILALALLSPVACVSVTTDGDPTGSNSTQTSTRTPPAADTFDCSSCTDYGFACDMANKECGDPLLPVCFDSASAYCYCMSSCTDDDLLNAYGACYNDDEPLSTLVACYGAFPGDCQSATDVCAQ